MITITKENYNNLMSIFSLVSNTCTDIIIKDGNIRQLSDNKNILYKVDLSDYINDSNFILSNISSKLTILKTLLKSNTDILLSFIDNKYIFTDNISSIKFLKPLEDYLQNSYISDSDFNNRMRFSNETIIFRTQLTKDVIHKINTYTKTLKKDNIIITFNNNIATIKPNENNDSTFTDITILSTEMETNFEGSCSVPVASLKLDISDIINLSCYHFINDTSRVVIKIEPVEYILPIEIYTFSRM